MGLGSFVKSGLGMAAGLDPTGITGGLIGGIGDIAQGTATFKGATRKIDKDAFKIGGSDKRQKQNANQIRRGDIMERQADKELRKSRKFGEQSRNGQSSLIKDLQRQSAGKGPSLAEAQMKRAGDRGLAQQLAAAAAQRGGNQASLQRSLARGQQAQSADIAQQAGQARIQEQLSARQQLAGALQQRRGQDAQLLDQNQQLYGAGVARQQQGIKQGQAMSQASQQQQANLQGMETDQFLAAQGLTGAGAMQGKQLQSDMIGGIMSAVSDEKAKKSIKSHSGNEDKKPSDGSKFAKDLGAGMKKSGGKDYTQSGKSLFAEKSANVKSYSDEKVKESKKSEGPKEFLDALKAYSYEYKDSHKNLPGAGEGRHMSVMAQDLEKAGSVGKSMVQDTPDGKIVDYGKGFGAILAAQAHLNERLSEIESKKKKD